MAKPRADSRQSKALVVECGSDYALDFELMLSGYGYDVMFAPGAAAAGLAMLESPQIVFALIDADTVETERTLDVMGGIRAIPIIVIASPEVLITKAISSNVRICRKPIVTREVERLVMGMNKKK
jgi:CheY-like chemotaxis protein